MSAKKIIVTLILATVMVLLMVACEGSADTAGTTDPVEAIAEPTEEVVEATEVAEPTEEVEVTEVTEEPTPEVVENNPDVIDGIDFTDYHNYENKLDETIDSQADYDSMRAIAITSHRVYAILKDGDSFKEDEETRQFEDGGSYGFFVYAPKEIVDITFIGGENIHFISQSDLGCEKSSKIKGAFGIPDEITGTDIECGAKVVYEDGSEETLTIYVTKEYVVEF